MVQSEIRRQLRGYMERLGEMAQGVDYGTIAIELSIRHGEVTVVRFSESRTELTCESD